MKDANIIQETITSFLKHSVSGITCSSNGWGQSYYKSAGAAENTLGNAITPSANNSPAVDWVGLGVLANDPDVTDVDLDWSDYNPQIGDEWEDKPGMIWITISAGAMGYPKSIDGYKFFIDDYDFDMGSPRGMVEGEAEEWKFGTGDLKLEETPRVVDEGDEVIVIPSSN